MGISLKVLPGVRIGATRRGMNASFGPRVARVHANSSGVRWSSGIGPVSVSGGVSGPRTKTDSDQGPNFEAFDDAMTVSDDQRAAKLDKIVEKHARSGWQVASRNGAEVKLKRRSPKLSFRSKIGVSIFMFVLVVIPFTYWGFTYNIWQGLLSFVVGIATILIKVFIPETHTYRKIEVGEWGVVHKHYHG